MKARTYYETTDRDAFIKGIKTLKQTCDADGWSLGGEQEITNMETVLRDAKTGEIAAEMI